ncbi:transcription factor bHLH110-like isoform X2 [Tasmannia lanceolata]|uniref:transcription factor bHLH110-like isoform X2 n=1 Tax=Tasmannia lanceolata TaxID=3420 RepID=UPI004062BA8F
MESANIGHQHQHQEQLNGSSLALPSFLGVGSNHVWNQNFILNGGNLNGFFSGSRDLKQNNEILVPPLTTSMFQESGFQWASNEESYTNHMTHELQFEKIKEELSDNSFPKFSNASNLEEFHLPSTSYIKHEREYLQDLNEKLLHKTFSSSCQINGLDLYTNPQSSATFGSLTTTGRGNFSRILPSANISNPRLSSSPFSSSFGANLQALDLLASAKFGGSYSQPSLNNMALFREGVPFGLDLLQEPSQETSNSPPKIFMNGVTETKRANGISEPKVSQAPPKKPRFESRSSFPPFKVRKEKLGDRIAALQQLVAPFGKTDTASVLMEAIGYIKFLHDQVELWSKERSNHIRCHL